MQKEFGIMIIIKVTIIIITSDFFFNSMSIFQSFSISKMSVNNVFNTPATMMFSFKKHFLYKCIHLKNTSYIPQFVIL